MNNVACASAIEQLVPKLEDVIQDMEKLVS